MFLVNSSVDSFAAALSRQSLFRSYGRFFAEFLSDGSLVGLGLLDPSTGVGLRYGRQKHKFTIFSSQDVTRNRIPKGTLSLNFPSEKPWTVKYQSTAPVKSCEI